MVETTPEFKAEVRQKIKTAKTLSTIGLIFFLFYLVAAVLSIISLFMVANLDPPDKESQRDKSATKTRAILALTISPVLILLAYVAIAYTPLGENFELTSDITETENINDDKANIDVVKRVGQLTAVPSNEEPSVATVSDVSRLRDQDFFRNALNGDKVIIYTESKRAILYRPSTDQIIEVAPINLDEDLY